jgi:hypothetical protein
MKLRLLLLTLACLSLSAAGPVLVMSFDGLGSRQFTAQTMPRLWKLSQEGQRGEGLPPFPATTFNGHATLATGCGPEHHGIVANGFHQPGLGRVEYSAKAEYLQREPLWVAATRSGVRTAVFHWPCATGPWEGVRPWRLKLFRLGDRDQEALAFSEKALRDGAALVMTYVSGTDSEGHYHGPDSRQVRAKLALIDQQFAPWLSRMLKATPGLRILLLADHGMARMERRIDVLPLLDPADDVIAHGGSAFVYLGTPLAAGTVERLQALGLRVDRPADLPAAMLLGGNPRVGDLVLQAPIGAWIAQGRTARERRREQVGRQGAHGYMLDAPEMRTWLVALGTGRSTPIPATPLWNIAPTVAQWLGVRWAAAPDGVPVAELQEQGSSAVIN